MCSGAVYLHAALLTVRISFGSGTARHRVRRQIFGCAVTGIAATPELRPATITISHRITYLDKMVKTLAGALALAALPSALAFRNTSPFFLFSTAEYAAPELTLPYPS